MIESVLYQDCGSNCVSLPFQTLKVIKHERYQILKNNREITMLRMRKVELMDKLTKLREPVAGPSWLGT